MSRALHGVFLPCYTLYIFHSFQVTLFTMLHSFPSALFPWCTFSYLLHYFHVKLISCSTFFMLHSFPVALILMLLYFHVVLFYDALISCSPFLFQVALFHDALISCCVLLMLHSFMLHFLKLHFFHVAFFIDFIGFTIIKRQNFVLGLNQVNNYMDRGIEKYWPSIISLTSPHTT